MTETSCVIWTDRGLRRGWIVGETPRDRLVRLRQSVGARPAGTVVRYHRWLVFRSKQCNES